LLAFALATACSPGADDGAFTPVAIHPFLEDAVLGDANAPVTIVEYASTTCHGCYELHTTLMPEIKAAYVDTGKVKLVYRVLPTPPAEISMAGAAIARCAGKDRFHDVIADLFANQPKILQQAALGAGRNELVRIGMRHGLSRDAVRTCIADRSIREYTLKVARAAPAYVSHTPSLIVNGDYIEHNSRETIFAMIDKKLAAATAPAPNP
jgi:protein-disulfide isomerase